MRGGVQQCVHARACCQVTCCCASATSMRQRFKWVRGGCVCPCHPTDESRAGPQRRPAAAAAPRGFRPADLPPAAPAAPSVAASTRSILEGPLETCRICAGGGGGRRGDAGGARAREAYARGTLVHSPWDHAHSKPPSTRALRTTVAAALASAMAAASAGALPSVRPTTSPAVSERIAAHRRWKDRRRRSGCTCEGLRETQVAGGCVGAPSPQPGTHRSSPAGARHWRPCPPCAGRGRASCGSCCPAARRRCRRRWGALRAAPTPPAGACGSPQPCWAACHAAAGCSGGREHGCVGESPRRTCLMRRKRVVRPSLCRRPSGLPHCPLTCDRRLDTSLALAASSS